MNANLVYIKEKCKCSDTAYQQLLIYYCPALQVAFETPYSYHKAVTFS